MEIGRYERPRTLEEAYTLIVEGRGLPIAGGAWSRMTVKTAALAVDLSDLDLRFIRNSGDVLEIGAMTTARDMETSPLLAKEFGNLFRDATSHIVGVQLRNLITVGGTVAGKFGFSDLNTALLALGATLVFHGENQLDMASFLAAPREKPHFLEKVLVRKGIGAAFQSLRVTMNDFAILNASASYLEGQWRIAVGARPAAARLSRKAADILGGEGRPSGETAARAGEAASSELSFGDDTRGSSEYRRAICSVLVKRAILEVSR